MNLNCAKHFSKVAFSYAFYPNLEVLNNITKLENIEIGED